MKGRADEGRGAAAELQQSCVRHCMHTPRRGRSNVTVNVFEKVTLFPKANGILFVQDLRGTGM